MIESLVILSGILLLSGSIPIACSSPVVPRQKYSYATMSQFSLASGNSIELTNESIIEKTHPTDPHPLPNFPLEGGGN